MLDEFIRNSEVRDMTHSDRLNVYQDFLKNEKIFSELVDTPIEEISKVQ